MRRLRRAGAMLIPTLNSAAAPNPRPQTNCSASAPWKIRQEGEVLGAVKQGRSRGLGLDLAGGLDLWNLVMCR